MKCYNPSEENAEKKRKIRDLENMMYKRREEELGSSTEGDIAKSIVIIYIKQ